ncbi:MAG: response regulator [Bacteroidetes bacterium]|nr:response regulator [Bacteroidota bacterium]
MNVLNKLNIAESKILLIDFSVENVKVLGSLLQENGFNVLIATDRSQAIELSKVKKPNVILLNVNISDEIGFEICEELKKDPHTKNIPVIFLTRIIENKNLIRAFEIGGIDYIYMPFDKETLIKRIVTHLNLRCYCGNGNNCTSVLKVDLKQFYQNINISLGIISKEIELLSDKKNNLDVKNLVTATQYTIDLVYQMMNLRKEDPHSLNLILRGINDVTNRNILIVEDNLINRQYYKSSLEALSSNIFFAINGEEALEVLNKNRVQVIVLDIGLSDMNGVDLARRIKQSSLSEQHIIAISGYSLEEINDKYGAFEFDHYIQKPVSSNELLSYVYFYMKGLKVKTNNKPPAQKYDHQLAKNLLSSYPDGFKNTTTDFLKYISASITNVEGLLEGRRQPDLKDNLHEVLNLGMYFGTHKLINMIMEIRDSKFPYNSEQLVQFLLELRSVQLFYEQELEQL